MLTAAVMAEVELRRQRFSAGTISGYIEQVARWLVSGDKFGLLLCGLPGTGKTTLMRATISVINLCELKDRYGADLYVSSIEAKELTRLYSDDYRSFKGICNRTMAAVDDLGTEPCEILQYGNTISPMTDFLTYRYNELLPTIISTNLTANNIREQYGNRIADRFNEMMEVIIFKNGTYRGQHIESHAER